MRTNLLLITVVLLATNAMAQPILTAATNNPVVGDAFRNRSCSQTGVTPGASGASVAWNFSTLTVLVSDSTKYVSPSSTPYSSVFPTSTIATNGGTYFEYMIANAGTLSFNGVGQAAGNVIFTDPLSVLNYPFTYTDVVVDTYVYSMPSASFYTRGIDTLTADAWGTLTLPSGTYTNVLRVHFIQTYTDSDASGSTPVVTHTKLEYYYWYMVGFHHQLLELDYDATSGTPVLTDVIDRSNSTTGVVAADLNSAALSVFPNPVKGFAHVAFTSNADQEVSITAFDVAGKQAGTTIRKDAAIGLNTVEFPVSGVSPGIYHLHIRLGSQLIIRKIQVLNN